MTRRNTFMMYGFAFAALLASSSLLSREILLLGRPAAQANVHISDPNSLSPRAARKDFLPGPYAAQILRVIDGDTVEARVAIWLGQEVTTRVRLAGIDAPELVGACPSEIDLAARARDALAAMLPEGRGLITDVRPDKYGGRVVARLWSGDGRDIGEAMLQSGHALPYAGRRRTAWCPLKG